MENDLHIDYAAAEAEFDKIIDEGDHGQWDDDFAIVTIKAARRIVNAALGVSDGRS